MKPLSQRYLANGNTLAVTNQLQRPRVMDAVKTSTAPGFAQDETTNRRFKLHLVLFRHNSCG
jgi:hypothetical protein